MRIHLLFIFAFAILSFARPARAYDPEFAKIVSYSKLMSLSPDKRAEYIRQVRLMVSEFEENQKTFASDANTVADSTERNLFLDMMIRDAEAMGAGPGAAAYTRSRQLQTAAPTQAKPRQLTQAELKFWGEARARTVACPALRFNNPDMARRLKENGAQVQCLPYIYKGCAAGYRSIGSTGNVGSGIGKRICYKEGLTDQQVAQRKAAAAQQVAQRNAERKLAATEKANETRRLANLDRAKQARLAARLASRARSPAAANAESPTATNNSDPADPTHVDQASDDATSGIGDADAVNDPEIVGTEAEKDEHTIFERLAAYKIDTVAVYNLKDGFNYKDADDVVCNDRLSVALPAETCSDASIKTARQAYFRQKEPHCLFAGNLRHYRNNQKKPGLCQHPTEFCISNVACREPDGKVVNPNEQIQVKCENPKEVLCNPMLFNLNEKGQALCIPPTKDATMACNARADQVAEYFKAKRDAGDKSELAKNVPFVTRVRATTGNDRFAQSFNGVQDAWNGFADEMNKICSNAPSKDLFCRECQVMKRRAADLNLIVFHNGTSDSKGNCYEFDKMGDFPSKANGTHNEPADAKR